MAAALASSGIFLKENVLVCSQLGLGCKSIATYRTSSLRSSSSLSTVGPRLAGFRCMSKAKDEQSTVEPQKKTGTNFFDLFSFSGPVPETVNGRLAMVGFTTALAVELASGQGLLGQIEDGGVRWFVGAALLLTWGTLVPLLQGISIESKSGGMGGIFTSQAEVFNGRAAMLGLVALAITEYVKGSPLI